MAQLGPPGAPFGDSTIGLNLGPPGAPFGQAPLGFLGFENAPPNALADTPAVEESFTVNPDMPDAAHTNIDNMSITTPHAVDTMMNTAPQPQPNPFNTPTISPQQALNNSMLGMLAQHGITQNDISNLAHNSIMSPINFAQPVESIEQDRADPPAPLAPPAPPAPLTVPPMSIPLALPMEKVDPLMVTPPPQMFDQEMEQQVVAPPQPNFAVPMSMQEALDNVAPAPDDTSTSDDDDGGTSAGIGAEGGGAAASASATAGGGIGADGGGGGAAGAAPAGDASDAGGGSSGPGGIGSEGGGMGGLGGAGGPGEGGSAGEA